MGGGKEGKERGRDLPDQCQTASYAPIQWSQIGFNGSQPRVVGSSWRSFPV